MIIAVLLNVNLCFGNDSSISSNSATDSTNTTTSSTSTTTSTSTSTTTTIATTNNTAEPMPGYYILLNVTIAFNGTNFDENELEARYTQWVYN